MIPPCTSFTMPTSSSHEPSIERPRKDCEEQQSIWRETPIWRGGRRRSESEERSEGTREVL
eukprot:scaffold21760_cov25-Tisochrysis_lutea.AAC.1